MSLLSDAGRLALGTLTVLPVRPPDRVDRSVGGLAMALAPVAALPLAAVGGLTVWLGHEVLAPPMLVAVVTVGVLAVGSGGLHLDGLADTADGLAAPGDRVRRLQVMRTGDVGPVGAATLVLVVLAQVAALAAVVLSRGAPDAAVTLALAVVVSRTAVTVACTTGVPAARDEGLGRAVAGSVRRPVVLLVVGLVAALAWVTDGAHGLVGMVLAATCVAVVLLRARRRLGGVTGDVLGACVELALAGYLVAQAVTLPA